MGIIFFFLWYLLEYLFRLIQYKNKYMAYKNISFERESYNFDCDENYLKNRRTFAWIKFL